VTSRVLHRKLEKQKPNSCSFTWLEISRLLNRNTHKNAQEAAGRNNFPSVIHNE